MFYSGDLPADPSVWVYEALTATFNASGGDDWLDRFYTEDFRIRMNGVELRRPEFAARVERIRAETTRVRLRVEETVSAGDLVAERHIVHADSVAHGHIEAEICAFLRFRGGRICSITEVAHVTEGVAL